MHLSLSLTHNQQRLPDVIIFPPLPPYPSLSPLLLHAYQVKPLYTGPITIIYEVFLLINLNRPDTAIIGFCLEKCPRYHLFTRSAPSLPLLPLSRLCRSSANWIPTAPSYTFAGIAGRFACIPHPLFIPSPGHTLYSLLTHVHTSPCIYIITVIPHKWDQTQYSTTDTLMDV